MIFEKKKSKQVFILDGLELTLKTLYDTYSIQNEKDIYIKNKIKAIKYKIYIKYIFKYTLKQYIYKKY